jgi:hypothetical protein
MAAACNIWCVTSDHGSDVDLWKRALAVPLSERRHRRLTPSLAAATHDFPAAKQCRDQTVLEGHATIPTPNIHRSMRWRVSAYSFPNDKFFMKFAAASHNLEHPSFEWNRIRDSRISGISIQHAGWDGGSMEWRKTIRRTCGIE